MEKLKRAGFHPLAEADGHLKMAREAAEGPLKVLIPLLEGDQELAIGSLQAILEQAGLTRAQFNALAPQEEAG